MAKTSIDSIDEKDLHQMAKDPMGSKALKFEQIFHMKGSPPRHVMEQLFPGKFDDADEPRDTVVASDKKLEEAKAAQIAARFANEHDEGEEALKAKNASHATVISPERFERKVLKKPAKPMGSSLAREISLSGLLDRQKFVLPSPDASKPKKKGGSVLKLKVLPACFENGKRQDVMNVDIAGNITIREVIELILAKYAEEKRRPALENDSSLYELRMFDLDDGTIDDDLPPLSKTGMILSFDMEATALCRAPDVEEDDILAHISESEEEMTRFPSLSNSKADKMLLRVLVDEQSHVVEITKLTTLDNLLSIVAKKRHETMDKADWEFYMPEEVCRVDNWF